MLELHAPPLVPTVDPHAAAAGARGAVATRPCLDRVDERLAAGEPSAGSLELSLRADHLRSRHIRQSVAQGLEDALRRAREWDEPSGGPGLHVDAPEVLALEQLIERLRCSGEVDPRGVAMARLLLRGEASPLYGGGPWHGVLHAAEAAHHALGSPIAVGGCRW